MNQDYLRRLEALEARVKSLEDASQQDRLMTFKEAAAYLTFSPKYLYKLCYTKRIPYHNPTGRTLLFYKFEIDSWVRGKYFGNNIYS